MTMLLFQPVISNRDNKQRDRNTHRQHTRASQCWMVADAGGHSV